MAVVEVSVDAGGELVAEDEACEEVALEDALVEVATGGLAPLLRSLSVESLLLKSLSVGAFVEVDLGEVTVVEVALGGVAFVEVALCGVAFVDLSEEIVVGDVEVFSSALAVELLAEVVSCVLEDSLRSAEDLVDLFLGKVAASLFKLVEVLLELVEVILVVDLPVPCEVTVDVEVLC